MTLRPFLLPAVCVVALVAASAALPAGKPAVAASLPAPPTRAEPAGAQVAVLAGGCFWGIEGVFERIKGVRSVVSGYAGGTKATANYSRVSEGNTGHAEAVRIVYDPAQISYGKLLQVFFSVAHDPTQVNRQFPDTGPNYRSAIFPQNPVQRQIAADYIASLQKARVFSAPIATRLESGTFFPAESYHQDFMRKNPDNSYTNRYDWPKIVALRKAYPGLYRK